MGLGHTLRRHANQTQQTTFLEQNCAALCLISQCRTWERNCCFRIGGGRGTSGPTWVQHTAVQHKISLSGRAGRKGGATSAPSASEASVLLAPRDPQSVRRVVCQSQWAMDMAPGCPVLKDGHCPLTWVPPNAVSAPHPPKDVESGAVQHKFCRCPSFCTVHMLATEFTSGCDGFHLHHLQV